MTESMEPPYESVPLQQFYDLKPHQQCGIVPLSLLYFYVMMFQPKKIKESDLKNVGKNKSMSKACSMANCLSLFSTSNLKILRKKDHLKKLRKRLLKNLLSLHMSTT